jgi:hypothetical protein
MCSTVYEITEIYAEISDAIAKIYNIVSYIHVFSKLVCIVSEVNKCHPCLLL